VEPANLRFLRRLVTVLTVIMIAGVVTVVALLVIRLNADPAPLPLPLPQKITLPDGTRATSFTIGSDWYGVVTQNDEILIYDQVTGVLRQRVVID